MRIHALPIQLIAEHGIDFLLLGMQHVKDLLVLGLASLAPVNVKLNRSGILDKEVIVAKPTDASASANPVMDTWTNSRVQFGLQYGPSEQFCPEFLAEYISVCF